jgi:hypothetical protein
MIINPTLLMTRVVQKHIRYIKFAKNRKLRIDVLKFRSIDNLEITGYFCRPKTQERVPCVVTASAGIHGSFFTKGTQEFDEFHLKWCWHLIKNNIAVLYIDKRGSYGYGEEFQRLNEIGGKEVDDVGIGASIIFFDSSNRINKIYGYGVSRMCLTFILAELKYKIFTGLFLQSGFYDIRRQMLIMETDYVKEQLGPYSLDNFPYQERSPIYFVEKIPSGFPILLVCGEDDLVVPSSQSINFYSRLHASNHRKIQLVQLPLPHTKNASDPDTPSGERILKLLLDFIVKTENRKEGEKNVLQDKGK